MLKFLRARFEKLKGTIFHPQWLSLRYQAKSKRQLHRINNCLILDIGSGNSIHSTYINTSNSVVRLDYPQTNTRYKFAPDVYGDASVLPFKDKSIDAALLLEVLEHVRNDQKALNEINRVLVAEGKLYLSIPFLYPIHDRPFDYRRYTVHGLIQLLESSNFKVTKILPHGNSLVTAFQLIILSLLEFCQWLERKNKLATYIICIFVYLCCILINIVSILAIPLNFLDTACLGYFIVAKKLPTKSKSSP